MEKSNVLLDSKPHFALLDGLRGVAALLVVWYHVFEGFAFAEAVNGAGEGVIKVINHGYLAVDFFFLLSGFVMGYAYDERWGKGFTVREFFRRRLIRLHPMVLFGALFGALAFLLGGAQQWDGSPVALHFVLLAVVAGCFMIPALPGVGYEVRGNGEMFPLNGPSWSLFFEYIGNILYALAIRRLATRWLVALVVLLGLLLTGFALTDPSGYGFIGVGWTLDGVNFVGGLLRMAFPYSLGLLMSRHFKPCRIKGAFLLSTLLLLVLFHVPAIAPAGGICLNGLYEMGCIIVAFPLIVWLSASAAQGTPSEEALYRGLGQLSYPLYLTHYPIMYLFYAWLIREQCYGLADCWQVVLPLYVGCVLFGWLVYRYYETPVRKRLAARG
ncbi:MAG: acyltransferase family protein [Bacteroides sp.]